MRAFFESLDRASPLNRRGPQALLALGALFLVFYAYVLNGTALQMPRKGDLDVYLTAAWAAREGQSLYEITDPHGWHYLYPPLLATLMIPLADAPPNPPAGTNTQSLPFWLSATIWYWLGIACLLVAVHMVASALEATGPSRGDPPPPRFSQGWWALRVFPLVLTLFYSGDALGRGQSTPILMLCLAGCGASMLRGRSLRGGLWLGVAAGIKLFPAYLLIYPLYRRDRRFLLGAAISIVASVLVPVIIMGPSASFTAYREFIGDRMMGEATGTGDPSVSEELHGTNSRIQSFEYMLYDVVHPIRDSRAPQPPLPYFLAHIAISAALTAAALWAMRRRADVLGEFLFFAALVQLVVPILPVSRPHYYVFGTLVLAGLYAVQWQRRRGLWTGWPLAIATIAYVLAGALDAIDLEFALDYGLATLAAMLLGALGLMEARKRAGGAAPPPQPGIHPIVS